MTHDERLMLAAQGAADPELAGCDVHRPAGVSAAEAMREAAATVCDDCAEGGRDVINDPDNAAIIRTARVLADYIRNLPLPADPRDAEIAMLRAALDDIGRQQLFDDMSEDDQVSGDIYSAYDEMIRAARAALAQSSVTP